MSYVKIISDGEEWKQTLHKHLVTDVYIRYEYVSSMAKHLHATPILIDYSTGKGGFLYCLLIMDIADNVKFRNLIPANEFFDAETPYGYGGPFFYGTFEFLEDEIKQCRGLIGNEMSKRGIISQFIRFYPLIFEEGKSTIIVDDFGTYKKTVYMDLADEDLVISNLDSQYRRKIRKAESAGVMIEHDKGERISEFIKLYNITMQMHAAEEMYYFETEYYESVIREFKNNIEVFYACLDGNIIGSSIFLFDKDYMHYHLGGRNPEVSKIPFENLLMVEAAKWGARHRIKKLHIGGGCSDNDSLFQYKKKFNRSGILPFYIGRSIFNHDKYKELIHIREISDKNFDPNNRFYIQYRF